MDDDRPVKELLCCELASGRGFRPVGRPKLRYKDTCMSALWCEKMSLDGGTQSGMAEDSQDCLRRAQHEESKVLWQG